tara:strand:- start:167 stop:415 length:249 start_codon:yes stop_codon:yes gene_type:complete
MAYKKKYWNKFVDEIMEDGNTRSNGTIIELLKVSMTKKCPEGRSRSGHFVPQVRVLSYYLRINDNYINIDKGTPNSRWKKVK